MQAATCHARAPRHRKNQLARSRRTMVACCCAHMAFHQPCGEFTWDAKLPQGHQLRSSPMIWSTRTAPAIVLAAAFAALLPTPPVRADVVTDWNARAETIAIEKQITPGYNARQMAILQVAVFEAVNAIERRYAPYRLTLTAERTLSKDAAAAAAAHAALVAFHPERQEALDAALAASLATVPEGEAKVKGVALGKTAAAEMLALRAKDGADAPESYRPRTSPGVYVPTTIPVFSQFPAVTPWAMTSGDQFRPAAPPALDSEVWTRDLNEIRELGARNSTVRTAEQTTIGRFWLMTGPRSYNPIVRQLAAAKEMDIVDCSPARPRRHGRQRRDHRRDGRQVCLQFLAPADGDPQRRHHQQRGNAARGIVAAAGRYADASGISLRPLHHIVGGRRRAHARARPGRPAVLADQHDRAGRHAHVEDGRRLQRGSRVGADLCRLPLPVLDRGRPRHGAQDRHAGGLDTVARRHGGGRAEALRALGISTAGGSCGEPHPATRLRPGRRPPSRQRFLKPLKTLQLPSHSDRRGRFILTNASPCSKGAGLF